MLIWIINYIHLVIRYLHEKNKKYVTLLTFLKVLFSLFCLRKQCVNKLFQLRRFSEFHRGWQAV